MIVKPSTCIAINNGDMKKGIDLMRQIAVGGAEELAKHLRALGIKATGNPKDDDIAATVISTIDKFVYRFRNKYLEMIVDVQKDYPTFVEMTNVEEIAVAEKAINQAIAGEKNVGIFEQKPQKQFVN